MTGFRPWGSNSCWQNARAKKPRKSSRRSKSIVKAPLSLVSVKITNDSLSKVYPRSASSFRLTVGGVTVPPKTDTQFGFKHSRRELKRFKADLCRIGDVSSYRLKIAQWSNAEMEGLLPHS